MQSGVTYDFTIDLSATPASGGGINPNSFCSMEVWGANSICTLTEQMWSSPVITHYGWQTYNVSITPSQNWTHIYFICSCGPLGYILLDNITPLQADNPNVFITSHVDGDAEACSFLVSGNINNAVIDSVILTGNFQESPLNATLVGLDWSGMLTFNGAGNQTVTATAYYTNQQMQETCVYTDVDLNVNAPTSAWSFTSQCDGIPISFVDASIPFGSSTITNWDWDFGDGNTSTTQSPSHTFATSGTYQVTLDITTSDGCGVALTQAVEVYEIPSTDFTFNVSCEGDITNFTDVSTLGVGTIQSWSWDFDDGNTASVQNPTNTFTNLGVYAVSLTVASTNGCSETLVQDVGMHPLPVADFGFADACLNTDFQLEDLSTVVTGAITTWDWDFDDGNTSSLQDPTNQYNSDGT
ncbi:MAG: PKD domain-containing protein, partial [Flavobacteriales bacterium]|nr:PKD domain-containing protein [Flavobacteriales bacterium]